MSILTLLTFKGRDTIVRNGGSGCWVISPHRAKKCDYVVCVRHQHGPTKAEGSEPHKHAFLVGKVSDVVPSTETPGRYKVEMSEYALVDGPAIPLVSASPTQYFPSLKSIGIDATSLVWHPMTILPSALDAGEQDAAEDVGDVDAMDLFMQAKEIVANGLHIPVSAVEIVIRG